MPTTPQVKFEFTNNNVGTSNTPELGISHVVARTTKGPFNDGSTLISSTIQFQRIFGDEIVPDGSVSNIKKALELGSKLRIFRVAGATTEPDYGHAKVCTVTPADGENPVKVTKEGTNALVTIKIYDPNDTASFIQATFEIQTKEMGSAIVDNYGYGLNRDFYLNLVPSQGLGNKVTLVQFLNFNEVAQPQNIIDSRVFFSTSTKGSNSTFVEAQTLQDFVNNVPNVNVVLSGTPTAGGIVAGVEDRIKDVTGFITVLYNYPNWQGEIKVGETEISTVEDVQNNVYMAINEGDNGGDSTEETWVEAFESSLDYVDAYQLILSHIHQHLPDDFMGVYNTVAETVVNNFEEVLYVEVPKDDSNGMMTKASEVLNKLKTVQSAVGTQKNIAYFGGGIKYYDDNGALQNCDVLGTVLGLGDSSASSYGPWYSFAGPNRGVVASAIGPIIENLGSPSKLETLQQFADYCMNLFVIKDTSSLGKRTMLWHNFTSTPKNDSEKFLSIVRLNLYLKKNLRPILESYLEEPNIWDTWLSIYYQAKKVLDDVVRRNGIESYTWQGDQFATSYSDLTVNTEADVRQGKYKVILTYKDIVTLQEVNMSIVIDSASNDVSIEVDDTNV